MSEHMETTGRDGTPLMVGRGDNVTVVHEVDTNTTPPRLARETVSTHGGSVRSRHI